VSDTLYIKLPDLLGKTLFFSKMSHRKQVLPHSLHLLWDTCYQLSFHTVQPSVVHFHYRAHLLEKLVGWRVEWAFISHSLEEE